MRRALRLGRTIPVIGAKNFTEQVVLGELLAQHIEAVTGMKVERRFYLAGSYICNQALIAGRIDSYVEYTGTALTAILKQPVDKDPQRVLDTVRRLYQQRYQVVVTEPLGFENTFAMVIRGQDAQRLHLTTLSQAARYSPQWKLGVGYEFEQRPDGLPGLQQAYGLKFDGSPRLMDLGLLYRALNGRQVDIIAGNSTDGPIKAFHLAVLQDDKHYFPPYQAVPLVRQEALDRWPQLRAAFADLAGKITAEEMQTMNEAVDGQHRDPAQVVKGISRRPTACRSDRGTTTNASDVSLISSRFDCKNSRSAWLEQWCLRASHELNDAQMWYPHISRNASEIWEHLDCPSGQIVARKDPREGRSWRLSGTLAARHAYRSAGAAAGAAPFAPDGAGGHRQMVRRPRRPRSARAAFSSCPQ